jgi:hypothetical protein
MTNMEGFAILGLFFFLGILIFGAVVFGFFARLVMFPKSQELIKSQNPDAYLNYREAVRDFLIRPSTFFKKTAEGPATFFDPLQTITFGGIFLSIFFVSQLAINRTLDFVGVLFVLFIPFSLTFISYALWIVATLLLFTITVLFKGSGSLVKTAQNLGFAVAFGLFTFGLFYFIITPFFFGVNLMHWPNKDPLFETVNTIGTVPIGIWTGYLMVRGLQYARNLPFVKAAVSVAVPVGLCLIYLYFSKISMLQ